MSQFNLVPFENNLHRDQVIELWQAVFRYEAEHNMPDLVIDKKLEFGDDLFFVAIDGMTVVGTVMAGYDGHRGWIYSLAVAASHRRRGIGSLLVAHAEQALACQRCIKINLQIMEGNESVAAFYSSLGYAIERRVSMGKRITASISNSYGRRQKSDHGDAPIWAKQKP